jgi:hypothetical protein
MEMLVFVVGRLVHLFGYDFLLFKVTPLTTMGPSFRWGDGV